jgi:hypothetical protein
MASLPKGRTICGVSRVSGRRNLSWLALAIVLVVPGTGDAQISDDERARTHFQSGRLYYEEGAYDRALAEFESAYRLSGRVQLLVNMANANERLGRHEAAVSNLRAYLEGITEPAERARIERRIENLERLQREREEREIEEEDAVVVDDAAAEGVDELDAELATEPARPRAELGLAAPLAAYGVGAAGFVVFAIAGPLALSRQSALREGCGSTQTCSDEDVAPADRAALIADIGLAVGVAGAVTGLILHLVHRKGRAASEGSETSFRLAPAFSRDGGGVMLEARF